MLKNLPQIIKFTNSSHKKLVEYYKNFGFEQIDSIFDKCKLKVIVILKSTKNDESEDEL